MTRICLCPWIAANMSWTPDSYIIRAASDIQALTPISSTEARGTPGTEKSLETQQVFGGQVSLMSISKVSSKLFGFGEYWFSDIACSKWSPHLRSWTSLLERAEDSVRFFLAQHFVRPPKDSLKWFLPRTRKGHGCFFSKCSGKSSGTCLPALLFLVPKSRWKSMNCVLGATVKYGHGVAVTVRGAK